MTSFDRRTLLGAVTALGATPALSRQIRSRISDPAFDRIKASLGPHGRLGVMAIDTATGQKVGFDSDGRYAMCSVFKLPLAAMVLRLCDRLELQPTEQLRFGRDDLLENSPVVQARLKWRSMSVEDLAAATVRQSDNSAANLLLRRVGGPAALTSFVRACGDHSTRIDRYELELNSNIPGDVRDTTTPAAMAEFTRTVLLGQVLKPAAKRKLIEWLVTSVQKPTDCFQDFRRGGGPGTSRAPGGMARSTMLPSHGLGDVARSLSLLSSAADPRTAKSEQQRTVQSRRSFRNDSCQALKPSGQEGEAHPRAYPGHFCAFLPYHRLAATSEA